MHKRLAVKTTHAYVRTGPDIALPVLKNEVDIVGGQAFVGLVVFGKRLLGNQAFQQQKKSEKSEICVRQSDGEGRGLAGINDVHLKEK